MNIQTIRMVGVAFLAAASVFAQGSQTLTAEVPFGFHVGNSRFAAGQYTVGSLASQVLLIQSANRKAAAMIMTQKVGRNGAGQSQLVFHRYGNEYYLSQVWDSGSTGSELIVTKRETELSAAARRVSQSVIAQAGTQH